LKEKKEVDHDALRSGLMGIPKIKIANVRDLLDMGISEIHELIGRSPEVLYEELVKLKAEAPRDTLYAFRMAVYYAETKDPDPAKVNPWAWTD
jgi:ribosomal protein L7/L12